MKKYILVFVSFTFLSALSSYAFGIKKDCYKRCMKELDDKERCERICKDDSE